MLSNLGHGPDINLEVNYNSSILANPDGLGRGWSWNLTHFQSAYSSTNDIIWTKLLFKKAV